MTSVGMIAGAWRTPLGGTIDAAMARLFAGERAAVPDPRGAYTATLIAPIRQEPAHSRQSRFLRRMGLFGLEVATEALAASGVAPGPRVGLFSGVGGLRAHWDDMIAAFEHQRDDGHLMWERGLKDVHPYWMLRHLSNNVHALASAELDLRGEGATFGGGNGGAQALAAASRALRDHAIDAALVVAYDSLLEPETLVELAARGSSMLVPGEAAAAVVLVRDADATKWGRSPFVQGDGEGAPVRDADAPHIGQAPTKWGRSPFLHICESAGEGALARCAAALGQSQLRDAGAAASTGTLPDLGATLSTAMGDVGAATAVVQCIALAKMLRANNPRASGAALALHTAAPGLASAVRVEVTP